MNDQQQKPKKQLKKSTFEFTPLGSESETSQIASRSNATITPYYPPTYNNGQNEIKDFFPQHHQHQMANLNEINLEYHPNTHHDYYSNNNQWHKQTQQQIVQPPILPAQVPEQKVKKSLRQTNFKFEANPVVEQQVEEEKQKQEDLRKQQEKEKRQQEEERRRQEEEEKTRKKKEEEEALLPKSYSKQDIEKIFQQLEDFSYFEKHDLWGKVGIRKHFDHKEFKRFDNRKEGKNHTQKKDTRQPEQNKQFDRGTKVHQQTFEPDIQKASIQIIRVTENIEQKQKKDEMKQLAEVWNQKLKETPGEKQQIEREIKYRLNQLAPDNYDQISKAIVELIVANQSYNDYLAEKIIEKSQVEPKYRRLYTKLCAALSAESKMIVQIETKSGKPKQQSKFKNSLLNKVQLIFFGRKQQLPANNSNLKPEEKEQYHIIRKNKIMGNVRFIGDLYLEQLLPFQALGLAISELVGAFISTYEPQGGNNEESIEGLIELIDQIGPKFKSNSGNQQPLNESVVKKLSEILNGIKRPSLEFSNFLLEYSRLLSLDFVLRIFSLLVQNYNISQRIKLLIENLQDKKQQDWQGAYVKKEEQAQSAKNLAKEQEDDDPLESKKNRRAKQQECQYVEKSQEVYPIFDLNEISIFVAGTFLMEIEGQLDALKEEVKRISESPDALLKFFEVFFQNMFFYKQIKKNLERAQLVFELLAMGQSTEQLVKKAIQNIFDEDLVYNLCESRVAQELIVDILSFFINEQEWDSLKKLYLKPEMEIDEYREFILKIANQLLEKYPDEASQQLIQQYFKSLDFEITNQLNFD